MCGIAGVIRWTGLEERDGRAAERLARLLAHRGPDGCGIREDAQAALVQTRLAMIGPERMEMPLRSRDGRYTIVYNGEIYNFRGAETDTEFALSEWMAREAAALEDWNGMFSFFVWDAASQRGFAAVDPLGVKPFFYHASDQGFWFASEPGALVESGAVKFAPEPEAIAEALVAPYFSSSVTPFRGVERLSAGHFLEVSREGVRVTKYFDFEQRAEGCDVEGAGEAVERAVQRALRADAPVGVFLSGGLDSSFVTAVARRQAWTISYDGEENADYARSLIVKSADRAYAEQVACALGLQHSVVRVGAAEYEASLKRTVARNDLIAAWEQEVSQDLLAEAAVGHVKAVLVGDAADETHFGYSFLLNPEKIASPRRILEMFGVAPLRREFLDDPVGHFTSKYETFARERGYCWRTEGAQRLAMSCLISHLWLARLMWNGDVHLMAHSIEGRVPFADRDLLELARRVPAAQGFRGGVEKWHLRRAAERFLDRRIAWRPKSALTKNLNAQRAIHRQFAEAWRECGAALEPYVDADAVEKLAKGEAPRGEAETGVCFRLLAVLAWFRRFEGAGA